MSRKVDSKQSAPEPMADEEGSGEEETQESQRRCQVCQDVPSSIICLSCSHTIDIPCAARVIIESAGQNQPDIGCVECQECGAITDLSEEVQGAILAYISEGFAENYGEEEQTGNEENEENGYQDGMGEEEQELDKEESENEGQDDRSDPKLEYRAIHGSQKAPVTSSSKPSEQRQNQNSSKPQNSSNGFGRGSGQSESNRPTPKRSAR